MVTFSTTLICEKNPWFTPLRNSCQILNVKLTDMDFKFSNWAKLRVMYGHKIQANKLIN
jgi:hypothetical protein